MTERYNKLSLFLYCCLTGLMLVHAGSVEASSYSSSSVAQVTGNVAPGSTNRQILVVTVDGSSTGFGQNWQIATCSFTMSNTDNANVTSAKLWINSSNSFGTATQIGATINNPAGTILFTLNTGAIGNNTRYLFLTFDIAANAPCSGNSVDAFVPTGGLVIASSGSGGNPGNKTPSPNNPSGNRPIFLQVTPSVSITSAGGTNCSGTPLSFTATPVNGGAAPVYQWKVNGINAGTNNTVFNSSILLNGDQVTCTLTSNAQCASPATASSNTIAASVISNPKPKLFPSDTVVCTGSSFIITAKDTGAYAGGWPAGTLFDYGYGPTTDSTLFVNGPGIYAVGVTLPAAMLSCNAVSNAANIIFIDAPVAILSADTLKCHGETNANIYAQIFLGSVPFHFRWYHNGTVVKDTISSLYTDTLKEAGAGIYCLVVSDSIAGFQSTLVCASDSACIEVLGPQQFSILNVVTNVACQGESDGAIIINASGGTPPYSYLWSNGATTKDISQLAIGTYTLTVTDINNCSIASTIDVITPVDITAPVLNCPVDIAVNAPAGFCEAIVSYITPAGTDNCPGVHTIQTAGLPSGSAFPIGVTANTYLSTDSVGNTSTCTFMVTVIDAEAPVISCQGDILANSDSTGCGTVVNYSFPVASDVCSAVTPVQTAGLPSGSVFPPGTTINTFQVTDAGNNVTTCSFNVVVLDITFPVITCSTDAIINNNTGACEAPFSYVVTATDNCSAVMTQTAGLPSGSMFPVGTTLNSFSATDPAGNTVSCSFNVTVNDNEAPVVHTQNISLILDPSGAVVIAPAMVDGGSTDNCGILTKSVSPDTFTCSDIGDNQVTLTVTDIHGNVSSATATVTIASSLTAVISPDPIQLCLGGSISLSGNPEEGSSVYAIHHWSGDNLFLSDTTVETTVFTGGATGTFSLTYTVLDNNGCMANDDVVIDVFPVITAGFIQTDVNCYSGNDGALALDISGGSGTVNYLWSNGSTLASVTNLVAGPYGVVVNDAAGCGVSLNTVITEPTLLTSSASATTVSCGETSDGTATVVAAGGVPVYTYLWNNGQTTATATGLTAGNYTATVTDNHGCTSIATSTVSPLTITLSLTGGVYNGGYNLSCAGGSNGTVNLAVLSGLGPFTYSWSTGATTEDLSGAPAGTYTVTVSNGACTSTSQILLTGPPAVSLTPSSTNVNCSGAKDGTATVAVAGGIGPFTYSWSTNPVKTTQAVSNLGPGNYSVLVTDANGCQASGGVSITQPTTVNTTGVITHLKCKGDSNGAINITAGGGTPPYTYLWNGGITTEDRTGLKAKAYTVTVTDSHGCAKKTTFTVTEPAATLQLVTTKTNVRCYGGSTGAAGVTASGGVPPFTYSWNTIPVKTTASISNIPAGHYICSVTDAGGCVKTANITVTQPTLMVLTTSQSNVTANGGHNGSASVSVSGGTPGYTYIWNTVPIKTTASINNLGAGAYTIKVTDSKGCSKTALVVITQPSPRNTGNGFTENKKSIIRVFPNPSTGMVSIETENTNDGEMDMTLFDVVGNRVYSDHISGLTRSVSRNDYDFSDLPKGVYIVEMKSRSYRQVIRLIIQ